MTKVVRRATAVALLVSGLSAATPFIAVAQPGNCCCPDGQTGVIYGCAPFCVPGKFLDTNTGLCTPIPPPQPRP
jgi:hypothetical protein